MHELLNILCEFSLSGTAVMCQKTGAGHINSTYLVQTDKGARYILQRVNTAVFKDPQGLMSNIASVTTHIAKKVDSPRQVLHIVNTRDGRLYYTAPDGSVWRVFDYIEDSVCLQSPDTAADFYEAAVGLALFLNSCWTLMQAYCVKPYRTFTTRPTATAYSAKC